MRKVYVELGALIREYRTEKKLTQLDLADKLGYDSTQFVSLFERGMSKVPVNVLGQLIVILGIPEKKVLKVLMGAYQESVIAQLSEGKARAAGQN